ncbi:MAG: hypothetical protein N3A00_02730 [Thermodesulfovibrio sp.]|nr:hypothetical protein [Thermodesulfovibrio sp.]
MNRFVCKGRNFNIIGCLFIFLIILSVFGILWIRSNVITIEYRLSQLEEKKKNLLREQKMLLAQKSSLTSIARLEKGELFSLHFPDRKKVIYITQDSTTSVNRISFNQRD